MTPDGPLVSFVVATWQEEGFIDPAWTGCSPRTSMARSRSWWSSAGHRAAAAAAATHLAYGVGFGRGALAVPLAAARRAMGRTNHAVRTPTRR